jgi:hypothetical protein
MQTPSLDVKKKKKKRLVSSFIKVLFGNVVQTVLYQKNLKKLFKINFFIFSDLFKMLCQK